MKANTTRLFKLEDGQMVLMSLEDEEEDELTPKELPTTMVKVTPNVIMDGSEDEDHF